MKNSLGLSSSHGETTVSTKESIQSLGYAKKLTETLEGLREQSELRQQFGVRIETPWGSIHARPCRRGGTFTGGLALTLSWKIAPTPWLCRYPQTRLYLRAGWDTRSLSRAVFRAMQAAPQKRPKVLMLWRRVEEEGPLPVDWLAQVETEERRTGLEGYYDTMTEEEAAHWLRFIEAMTPTGEATATVYAEKEARR